MVSNGTVVGDAEAAAVGFIFNISSPVLAAWANLRSAHALALLDVPVEVLCALFGTADAHALRGVEDKVFFAFNNRCRALAHALIGVEVTEVVLSWWAFSEHAVALAVILVPVSTFFTLDWCALTGTFVGVPVVVVGASRGAANAFADGFVENLVFSALNWAALALARFGIDILVSGAGGKDIGVVALALA